MKRGYCSRVFDGLNDVQSGKQLHKRGVRGKFRTCFNETVNFLNCLKLLFSNRDMIAELTGKIKQPLRYLRFKSENENKCPPPIETWIFPKIR